MNFEVEVLDTLFSAEEIELHGLNPMRSRTEEFVAVVIQNSASEFLNMFADPNEWLELAAIYDGRNLFQGISPIKGIPIFGIGIGEIDSLENH